jgi:hypothetical protein
MPEASRLRSQVAEEAARLIEEQGIDFLKAKHKAASRLGATQHGALPSNKEIEQRLIGRHLLFGADQHSQELTRLRRLALRLMGDLAPFSPRAVGSVVNGALSPAAGIELHLFAAGVEAVCGYLDARNERWNSGSRQFMHRRGEREPVPSLIVDIEDVVAELVVFGPIAARQAPLSPVDGRPMRRLNPKRLAALLAVD